MESLGNDLEQKVQKPILQIQTVRKYIEPIEVVTDDFIKRFVFRMSSWLITNDLRKPVTLNAHVNIYFVVSEAISLFAFVNTSFGGRILC